MNPRKHQKEKLARERSAASVQRELQMDRVEEMLAQGVPASMIVKVLKGPPPQGYSMTTRAAHLLIDAVYARWKAHREEEEPHRREKVWKMAEVLYAKATAKSNLSVAASLLGTMHKMLGPAPDPNSEATRARILAQLGDPPTDPTQLALWTQRAMVLEMVSIIGDAKLEPERRVQFIAMFGGKIGDLHPKALAGRRMEELETQVATLSPRDANAFVDGETEEALQAFAERLRASIAVEPPTEH